MENNTQTRIWNIVAEQYANSDFNVAQLSNIMCVSPATLFRQCKKYFNKTPHELLEYYRIEKAKSLLFYDDIRITDVAFDTGYNCSKYFSKKFKSLVGCAPQKFKNKYAIC